MDQDRSRDFGGSSPMQQDGDRERLVRRYLSTCVRHSLYICKTPGVPLRLDQGITVNKVGKPGFNYYLSMYVCMYVCMIVFHWKT
jgi:hypothetical protein